MRSIYNTCPNNNFTLSIVRRLVKATIEKENNIARNFDKEKYNELKKLLLSVDKDELFKQLNRHKIINHIYESNVLNYLNNDLHEELKEKYRFSCIRNLKIIHITTQIIEIFKKNDIQSILLKGFLLSGLTTNSINKRDSGDIDILIEINKLSTAISLLQNLGFIRMENQFPEELSSVLSNYSKFIYNEITLYKRTEIGIIFVDLHWRLSYIRGNLPTFNNLMKRSTNLTINSYPFKTLSQRDSFFHSCMHASCDEWKFFKHLIDIDRLSRNLHFEQDDLNHRYVKYSLYASFLLTRSEHIKCLINIKKISKKYIYKTSFIKQNYSIKEIKEKWHPLERIKYAIHFLLISGTFTDIFVVFLTNIIRPYDLSKVNGNNLFAIPYLLTKRLIQLINKLNSFLFQ